ncbi:unnamed protein product [Rotaria sp. Silwood1]|nr:unnamed protein product [Rotaria sp. Silwood1]
MLHHLFFFLLVPCTVTFTGPTNYPTGVGSIPTSVTLADVDGDGDLDAIVSNKGTNDVGVLLGNGDGTFAAQKTYGLLALSAPASVTTADVDDDGDLDIIVANTGTNNIGILRNNPTGTFPANQGPRVGFLAGSAPASVTTADVDGDGDLDIIVANTGTNDIGILINNPTGTFPANQGPRVGFFAGSAPASVTTADVNGDGKADIIVAYKNTNNVGVLLNSGTGTFPAAPVTYGLLANSAPTSVKTADANGDGKLDIIVANSGTNNFGVILGNGDGTFAATQLTYATGTGTVPVSVVAGDIDRDGDNDVLVADSGTNQIGVFLAVCSK